MGERAPWTSLELAGAIAAGALGLTLDSLPLVGRTFAALFRDLGGELPLLSELAISYWFPLGLGCIVHACVGLAFVARVRRFALGSALVIGVLGITACIVGLYAPVFQLAGAVKAE